MPAADPYRVLQVLPDADQAVVQAAFRALAMKYHPDRDPSATAARRMIELNEAYALVRSAEKRAAFDRGQRRASYGFSTTPHSGASNGAMPPPRSASAGTQLQTGRYSGWTLRDLAHQDPDYLRWLSRHSSGLRYRTEIYQILGRMGSTAA
ncbi:MAG: DnaJ domain-containing protein [Chloroflexota bacterium]